MLSQIPTFNTKIKYDSWLPGRPLSSKPMWFVSPPRSHLDPPSAWYWPDLLALMLWPSESAPWVGHLSYLACSLWRCSTSEKQLLVQLPMLRAKSKSNGNAKRTLRSQLCQELSKPQSMKWKRAPNHCHFAQIKQAPAKCSTWFIDSLAYSLISFCLTEYGTLTTPSADRDSWKSCSACSESITSQCHLVASGKNCCNKKSSSQTEAQHT